MFTQRPRRHAHRGQRGVGIVELTMVAPVFLLLLLGAFVLGIVVMNQMQLTNAVRDGARAAAVCGGPARNTAPVVPTLPDGHTTCDSTALITYINSRLSAVPGGAITSVCVYVGSQDGNGSGTTCVASDPVDPNILDKCNKGTVVEVDIAYPQQLYVPLVGNVLGSNGTTTRTLHAAAQAVCEQ
ncbi:MAG TPA: TadE/TadG family type IV pilus assembly protein [Candidatus Angelobacter sp.]|jgi:Flp pilus assembly protein TadG|nr:TadE/TadG family type IV pilus assembly protein [Candidatus Angelobacter sp.]